MKQLFFLLLASFLLQGCGGSNSPTYSTEPNAKPDTIRVFYLGGQSNMEGYGFNKDLPPGLNKSFDSILIFTGNHVQDHEPGGGLGLWEKLQPGFGTGFSSDGKTNNHSDRFGVELPFGEAMARYYPGQKIALIKYARGGTSMQENASWFGSWAPGASDSTRPNQYDFFLKTLSNAMSVHDIDDDGREDILIPSGILWMQGEADASHTAETANAYKANLEQMMSLMRAAFHNNDLPVVIGMIADSKMDDDGKMMDFLDVVQQAQRDFVSETKNAALVDGTQKYDFTEDRWHFTSKDYIDLGNQFAQKLINLNKVE